MMQQSGGNYDRSQFNSWIDNINDPTELQHVASKVIGKIGTLAPSERETVVNGLRNDTKFQQGVELFSRQTA